MMYCINKAMLYHTKLQDTKGAIRSRKSKDRQYNGSGRMEFIEKNLVDKKRD